MPGQSPVIVPVTQRTPEWLEAKEHGIGASEAAASIGLSDYESQVGLWARKLGLVPAIEENLPMRVGTALEPLIAELYTEATGVKVRRANLLRQHPEHAFMLASLDRRAGRKPVELKYSARGSGYGEPGTDEIPDDALVQVVHQLAVTDEPEADVAVLIGGKREVQIYTVRRDATAEAAVIEREAIFWHAVETRTEPPVDGSEATHRALAAIYPRDDGEVIEADDAMRFAMRDLRQARQLVDQYEVAAALARAQIEAHMGTAAKLVAPGLGSISWKTTKDRETTDWKRLALGLRTAIERVRESRDASSLEEVLSEGFGTTDLDEIEAIHTETKPGTRPFTPRWEEEE